VGAQKIAHETNFHGHFLFMICCYIIFSKKLNRFYIGVCHDDLQLRIEKHNSHEYGLHRYTAKANDWEGYLIIECETFSQATKIEKRIKRMKSSVYVRNLLKYPEMVAKLKEED
jgi:putative endonuclease